MSTRREPLSRERIVAEAARVFNRLGYHGASLDDIARALGVSKAALYYHVRSKEEMLYLCSRAPIDLGLESLRRALGVAVTPDVQLRLALTYYVEAMTDQLRGSVVLVDTEALSPEHRRDVIAGRDEYERGLRDLIARGIAEEVFVPCDPRLVGFAILGAMNWIPRWYDPEGARSGREIAEAFAAYLVRGLLAAPARRAVGAPS